jgi:hypothetical protein
VRERERGLFGSKLSTLERPFTSLFFFSSEIQKKR